MYYYILNGLIGGFLYPFILGLMWSFCLEKRWPKVPNWGMALILALLTQPAGYIRSQNIGNVLFEIMGVLQAALILAFVFLGFKGKLWKRILAYTIFVAATFIGELFSITIMRHIFEVEYQNTFANHEMFVLQTACMMFDFALFAVMAFIWNNVFKHQKLPRHAWVFVLFPISQLIVLWNWTNQELFFHREIGIFAALGFMLGFVADIVLLYAFLNQGEKEALAKRVREMEHLQQVEQLHYQSIEIRREELAQIRHDFNNQLTTALYLTEQGEQEQAKSMLEQLRRNLANTKENTWCGNVVINAVLNEQAAACERDNIDFSAEILIEETAKIQPVHLCSVFSNLLDNARWAAAVCPVEERKIVVKAAQKGDYIHIKVENTSAFPEKRKKTADGHGYGQEILKDIAMQYNGDFYTDWKEGIYTALISVENTIIKDKPPQ